LRLAHGLKVSRQFGACSACASSAAWLPMRNVLFRPLWGPHYNLRQSWEKFGIGITVLLTLATLSQPTTLLASVLYAGLWGVGVLLVFFGLFQRVPISDLETVWRAEQNAFRNHAADAYDAFDKLERNYWHSVRLPEATWRNLALRVAWPADNGEPHGPEGLVGPDPEAARQLLGYAKHIAESRYHTYGIGGGPIVVVNTGESRRDLMNPLEEIGHRLHGENGAQFLAFLAQKKFFAQYRDLIVFLAYLDIATAAQPKPTLIPVVIQEEFWRIGDHLPLPQLPPI